MSEELKAIDFLRAKTISYESDAIELHYALVLYNLIMNLQAKNQELKKQLENCYCNRTDCSSRIKDSKQYDSLVQKIENQQKEFIEYLESEIKIVEDKIVKYDELLMNGKETDIDYYESMINKGMSDACKEILSKYKEIIGDKDEN